MFLKAKPGRPATAIFPTLTLVRSAFGLYQRSFAKWLFLSLRFLALILFIFALARPQIAKSTSEIEASGIDIILGCGSFFFDAHARFYRNNASKISPLAAAEAAGLTTV